MTPSKYADDLAAIADRSRQIFEGTTVLHISVSGLRTVHAVPSVWSQLAEAVGRTGGGGGSAAAGSVPVIATEVVSLMQEIRGVTRGAYLAHCRYRSASSAVPIPVQLRAVAISVASADGADAPRYLEWLGHRLGDWVGRSRATLQLDAPRPRYLRGVPCPNCLAYQQVSNDPDGQVLINPAMAITWRLDETDPEVLAIECRACRSYWPRGEALDRLTAHYYAGSR